MSLQKDGHSQKGRGGESLSMVQGSAMQVQRKGGLCLQGLHPEDSGEALRSFRPQATWLNC